MNRGGRIVATLVASILLTLGAAGCPSCTPVAAPSLQNSLPVDVLLKELHIALDVVAAQTGILPVPMKTATLNLQTVATSAGGGSIQLWVVSFGHSSECEATQELILTLVPGESKRLYQPKLTFGKDLGAAILAAAEAVQKNHDPNSPLKLRTLQASVSFVVTEETKGSGKFAVLPVTAGLEGSVKSKALQKVTLVFEEEKKEKEK